MRIYSGLLCLVFCFLTFSLIQAQNALIHGTIVDTEDKPLAFASVILNNSLDSSYIKGEMTDEKGQFTISKLSAGDYYLAISYVGLGNMQLDISLAANEKRNTGPINLVSSDGTDLEEVLVSAKRPLLELKNDKMIFNVENSVNAIGDNGLELLRKAPGVLIDNNNNITMLGRTGVRIFINGRPSPLRGDELVNYLEGLQSVDVDAIEIITNPGSKYEAEGNAGIINIRLKKETGLGANMNLNLGYAIGERSRSNGGLSGNFRNKFMNAFGSLSLTRGYWVNQWIINRNQFDFSYNQFNSITGQNTPLNFRAGADFFLSKKSTLGILVEGGNNDFETKNNGAGGLGIAGSGVVDSLLLVEGSGVGSSQNISYNVNYLVQFNKNSSLSIDASYGTYDYDRIEGLGNFYTNPDQSKTLSQSINETFALNDISIAALRIDYERPFLDGTLGLGAKISDIKTENSFEFFNEFDGENVLDIDRTNDFEYLERVGAAYVNYSAKISKKVNFQVGLRLENTYSKGQLFALKDVDNSLVERDYLNLFPSASLNISLNDDNKLQLSYSRRINRPSYQNLNPFEFKLDELTFHRGNPFLQPEYSNIFQVRHSLKLKFNTTVNYSRTTQMMVLQVQADEGKQAFRTWLNLPDQFNYSINFASPTSITDWWGSFVSLTAYYRQNKGTFLDGENVDLDVKAFNIFSQQTFTLNKKTTFELSGFFNSPTLVDGTTNIPAMWNVNVGFKRRILNGKGNLALAVSDVFKTMNNRFEIQYGALEAKGIRRRDTRRLRANLTYFFGDSKVKKARKRKTSIEDEKKRAN